MGDRPVLSRVEGLVARFGLCNAPKENPRGKEQRRNAVARRENEIES